MNRAKEIYSLSRCLAELTDGQAELLDYDPEVVDSITIQLSPNSGLYQGGSFSFQIELGARYPSVPPLVRCVSGIYHPNIDSWPQDASPHTNVCLNILEDSLWCEGFGLKGCVIGLLYLLHHPNFDDAINPAFEYRDSLQEYERDIKLSLQGKPVGFLRQTMDDILDVLIPSPPKDSPEDITENCRHRTQTADDILDVLIPSPPKDSSEDIMENCQHRTHAASCESTVEAKIPEFTAANWKETHISQHILDTRNSDPEYMDCVSSNKDIIIHSEVNCVSRPTGTSDITADDASEIRSIRDDDRLFEDILLKQDMCNRSKNETEHDRVDATVGNTQDLHDISGNQSANRVDTEKGPYSSLTDDTDAVKAPADAADKDAVDTAGVVDYDELLYQHFMDNFDD